MVFIALWLTVGREGFVNLISRVYGQDISDVSSWMGHTTIYRTKRTYEDSTGKFSDLDFANVSGVGSVPSVFSGTDGIPFHNNSVACSEETPDLKPGFKVHFANRVEASSEAVTLVWLPFSTSSAPQ